MKVVSVGEEDAEDRGGGGGGGGGEDGEEEESLWGPQKEKDERKLNVRKPLVHVPASHSCSHLR